MGAIYNFVGHQLEPLPFSKVLTKLDEVLMSLLFTLYDLYINNASITQNMHFIFINGLILEVQ